MVNISKLGDSTIKFTFTDNDRYLYNGEITLPLNSLILEFDTSDLVIFKKIDGDVFVTFLLENSNFNSKAELESWYKANMVGSTGGGGGVTSGEVQTMIDESISGKADSSAVTQEITAAVSGKADSSSLATVATSGSYDDLTNKPTIPTVPTSNTAFTNDAGYITSDALSGYAESSAVTEEISAAVSGKVDTNTYTAYTANTQTVLNSKLDATAYTPVQVSTAITENDTNPVAGGAVYDKVHVTSGESSETTLIFEERIVGGTQAMFSTNYPSGATIVKLDINNVPSYLGYLGWYGADESFLGGAKITQDGGNIGVKFNYTDLTPAMSGTASYTDNVLTVEVTGFQNASLSDIAYFSHDLMSTYNSIKAVTTPKEYWIKEYVDAALSGKANSSDVYTKSETSGATEIATALSGKQDTLSAGTNITIVDNVISAGGGGSLNIPISAGTGTYSIQENAGSALGGYSHAEGSNTTASGDYSHAEGYNTMAISAYSHTEGWQTEANGLAAHAEGYTTKADGENSHAEGNMTETNNLGEHASGSYNLSHKASNTFGDSGNTLFSVGNGTSTGTSRHNAFEIRQNGDIYFEYDGADTKLQDKLDEIESVTAAALNNLNSRFGGLSLVKLTQTQYDNLQTKDSNTLYVIVN